MFIQAEEKEIKAFKEEVLKRRNQLIADRKVLEQQVKVLRSKLKSLKQPKKVAEVEKQIERLKTQIGSLKYKQQPYDFPITQVLPIVYKDYVYNYQLLKAIENKTKGFEVTVTTKQGVLSIEYTKGTSKGCFTVQPLAFSEAVYVGRKLNLVHVKIRA